ncbi:MAG: sulfurtransferase [Alteromonadaceae bacterium]|jgi:rhodanese-related sulfurtransferase|uniref:Rhodanese-like domain-containing protein n=1 Tax=Rheinheimera aquimaris TaxID=412437 RepID=A0ABP3P3P0_9GAMM|nr:rhodanese-like domain-containing protein [Rheinheimera aquimaris]MBJ91462.1 sulfurtransferase [Alteromonadaceae bacterium]MCB5214436.1 sulfurtransferase [Rheinheimera aquimaris]MCD1599001.1 sulfurtransferase [Rheinheimera aquimaris]HBN88644.1 sulfurtransferase [Rheinheimera sp.]|tara:strand:- start:406 stop:783 length:378 start_codon:yes stop_codon:yes gene_type:complete
MSKQHAPGFVALVEQAKSEINEISIDELLEHNQPYVLLDIREDHEWDKGHLPEAMHLGKGIIERDIEQTVADKKQKIVLYCGGGYRSALSAQTLQQMGYQNVYSLAGGYREWCERNLPLEVPAVK